MTVAELIALLHQHDPAAVVVLPWPTFDADDTPNPFSVIDMQGEVRAVQLRASRRVLVPLNVPSTYTYEIDGDGAIQGVLIE